MAFDIYRSFLHIYQLKIKTVSFVIIVCTFYKTEAV